jgi:proteic killer suppression protein
VKFHFINRHLKTLYETGRSKKYPLQKQVIQGFFQVMAAVDAAVDIHDLQQRPSLNIERMKGTESRFSLRINRKYRLEVEIDWENEEKTIGILGIDEISTHYQ